MSDEMDNDIDRDELHDRLIDGALRELVGGERPPDLSNPILAASGAPAKDVAPVATVATLPEPACHRSRFPWSALAVAVCLMVGVTTVFLSNMSALRAPRGAAHRDLAASTPAATAPASDDDADELRYMEKPLGESRERAAGEAFARESDELAEATDLAATVPAEPAAPDSFSSFSLGMEVNSDAGAVAEMEAIDGEDADAPATESATAATSTQAPIPASQPAGAAGDDYRTPADGAITTPSAAGEPQVAQLSDQVAPIAEEALVLSGGGAAGPEARTWRAAGGRGGARYARGDLAEDAYGVGGEGGYDGGRGGYGGRQLAGNGGVPYWRNRSLGERGLDEGDGRGGITLESRVDRPFRTDSFGLDAGRGPGEGGDQYARIVENPFLAISAATTDNRLSTFSIDVDTASYANVRQFLLQSGTLPPPDAVRIEELVNYFDYDYTPPTGDVPFASNVEVAACPWAPEHRLVRVGIKGREMPRGDRPKSNLVFLIDVSGSMDEPNKLPLLVEGMRMLTRELGENDRVAIVVYASSEGLALESTRGDQQQVILDVLDRLSAGGSTAGGAGIQLAYRVAEENFIDGGVNRVILCTDGDFNVGVTSPAELQRLAETKAKDTGVFLTVLGFGRGNLNDAMMEQVADHGNGNYHYVDNQREARKVLVEEMTGTLVTIAKDVKIQVEFNPAQVAAYRLIGYENRVLAAEDFNDDKKDAGEIGAGHTVTALYEVVPAGAEFDARGVDELRYAAPAADGEAALAAGGASDEAAGGEDAPARAASELLTLKIRYKQPDGDTSTKLEFPITDSDQAFSAATPDFQFAAAVASFGMLLRGSEHAGASTFAGVLEIAESASRDRDEHGYRREFVELVQRARELSGQ